MLAEGVGLGEQVVGASGVFFWRCPEMGHCGFERGWASVATLEALPPKVCSRLFGGRKASQSLKAAAPGMEWRTGGGPSGTGGQGLIFKAGLQHDSQVVWRPILL